MIKREMTKSQWLEMNGFSQDESTYLVLGNSYAIKEELKEFGFKYSPLLRWHNSNCDFQLPEGCYYKKLEYQDIFVWSEDEGVTFLKEGARDVLDNIFNPPIVSNSKFVGEIGEKIQGIAATVVAIGGYQSAYGYKWVYTFEDEEGNRFTWFTTSQQAVSQNYSVKLSGTIKQHVVYKGAKTTQLTRCKLTVL